MSKNKIVYILVLNIILCLLLFGCNKNVYHNDDNNKEDDLSVSMNTEIDEKNVKNETSIEKDVDIENSREQKELVDEEKYKLLNDKLNLDIYKSKKYLDYNEKTYGDEMTGVFFGSYYQNNDYEKEPIEWIVYKVENEKALLVSKYIIENGCYDTYAAKEDDYLYNSNWENSNIRKKLNDEFFNTAFKNEEKKLILTTYLNNDDGTIKTKDTNDKIFILSDLEYLGYKMLDKNYSGNRMATSETNYVKNKKNNSIVYSEDYQLRDGLESFWLRTNNHFNSAYVSNPNGDMENTRIYLLDATEECVGIRPAMWVKYDITDEVINNIEKEKQMKIQEILQQREDKFVKRDFDNVTLVNNIINAKCVKDTMDISEATSINLGKYWYGASEDDIKDIEWLVLDKDLSNNKALLISKFIIDWKLFDDRKIENTSWDISSLRTWLNNYFINRAFINEEKAIISLSSIKSRNSNGDYVDTSDLIFCLSETDCYNYFPNFSVTGNNTMHENALLSPYALYKNPNMSNTNGYGSYWLRDLRRLVDKNPEYVTTNGGFTGISPKMKLYDCVGVRPAMWVDLNIYENK